MPFLLLFKHYGEISHSASLAQHQHGSLPWGAVFFPSRAVQSQCAPDGAQYMVVFPLREMCWPKVEGGDGGAWISGIEAGEQCGKEKAVKEVGGQQKVGFICRMSTKIPFM